MESDPDSGAFEELEMRMQRMAGLFALALLAVPAAIATTAGEKAEYKFNAPLDNGRGVTSMADFRGKPVLIDFWGTR